ncbi:TonB-dependent receptor plug domain-containing protein [Thalassomonas actiniarum]|uniref:TonB-dependent receptor plug domain-containing protein n=1 Tax=Thalassomonas actiniarum TaxID=485447 RepID=A0AAF0C3D9_9GAMM|nr:TonB-dependent receptor [Thalassomonas actiniarum]WDD98845.1 TonB-dependent receptor plug domain-containing protein [Thalassomonas actiniarum]
MRCLFHPGLSAACYLLALNCFAVSAEEDVNKLFSLSLAQLSELKVTSATKHKQPLNQIPATVYIFTEQDFSRYGFRDLKDVLKYTCGVEYGDAHSWLQGGQRGFTGTWAQTRILVDGRDADEISRNKAHVVHQYPLYNVKRVEVIQGPASSLYGADVFVGLINIVTKTSDNSAPGQQLSMTYARGEDELESSQINYSWIHREKPWGLSLHASYLDLKDPDFSDYVLTNEYSHLNQELRAGFMRAGFPYKDDNEGLNLLLNYQRELSDSSHLELGVDVRNSRDGGGIENPELIYSNFKETKDQLRTYLSYQKTRENEDKLSFDYQFVRERTIYDFNLRNLDLGNPPPLLSFAQEWTHLKNYTLQYDINNQALDNYLILGLNYKHLDQAKPQFELSSFDATEPFLEHKVKSLYVQDQQSFWQGKVLLTLGARHDDSDLYGSVNTVRGAVQYNISANQSVKLLYGEAFREPTLFELSTNKDLNPSDITTTEFVYDHRPNNAVSYKLSLYHSEAKNIIAEDRQSTDGIDRNIGKKEADGLEFSMQWQLKRYQGFFWLNGVDVSEELDVAEVKMAAGITRILDSHWQVSAITKYTSEVDTQAFNENADREIVEVDSYHTLDIILKSKEFTFGNAGLASLTATIKNAFNHKNFYSNPRGPDPIKFLDQGRSFSLQANFTF